MENYYDLNEEYIKLEKIKVLKKIK